MTLKVAINGYGRIGRCFLRALYESQQLSIINQAIDVVAINELADNNTIAHLTKYDSTHGRFPGDVLLQDDCLYLAGNTIRILHEENIEALPWKELDIDVLIECTGSFTDRATAEQHLAAGAKRLLFSQPAESDVDTTIVFGVNDTQLLPEHKIISNASCTTNCIVPVIDALHKAFGIESGVITTIHSAMNDQPVIDAYHNTDLRKTRSAMQSIIPVDTGLAKGIDRLLPNLAGRFQAQAMRVPTVNVSAMDLSVVLTQTVNTAAVNSALAAAAERMPSILGYTDELLASCDFNHDARSGIIDASQTRVAGGTLVKVLTWFDNEWGFANRMLDVVNRLSTH
ncbi:MAG: type I glyceraldehyde-3-phosphate dehydrogenase [Cellvibrionaceae bacterium]